VTSGIPPDAIRAQLESTRRAIPGAFRVPFPVGISRYAAAILAFRRRALVPISGGIGH
jgi:hypothetical protein